MATDDRQRGGGNLPSDWDAAYGSTPPWDIGRPQPPFRALAEAGQLRGRVLDIGCGTGEHALLAAAHGCEATGIDVSPTAVAAARAKARDRALEARFEVRDVLDPAAVDGRFDMILDSGLLHVLAETDRPRLAASIRAWLAPDGTYDVLCFSDRVPGDSGPRRLRREDLEDFCGDRLALATVEEAWIEATITPEPIPAWFARITRA